MAKKKQKQQQPIKGYKVFDNNMQCRGYQFKEGKTYNIEGDLKLCENGFHFCTKLVGCFNYYDFNPANRVHEILATGDIITDGDKSCTSSITIGRHISWHEVLDMVNIGKGNTGRLNSGDSNSGHRNSGHRNSGDYNSGNYNSGNYNSGNYNSGNYNSGNANSGFFNSGNSNSGHRNSGHYNSGDYNSGHRNSGDSNSGHSNSGHRNSGHRNSGDYNSGNYNSGFFNTDEPTVRMFGKDTGKLLSEISLPYIELPLNVWDDKQQKLITLSYKDAWKKAWEGASPRLRQRFLDLPNFDAKIFEEITGIALPVVKGNLKKKGSK